MINQIENEKSTASNIKSDYTRHNVCSSLGKISWLLKSTKTTVNGLIIFCGMHDGKIAYKMIKPPIKLTQYLYRCDAIYHLDILRSLLDRGKKVGFLAIDTKDAGWGILSGNNLQILDHTGSGIPGKHRQGGQSAKRFEKQREMHVSDYFARIAATTRKLFLDENTVDSIILSGPGHTKNQFNDEKRLEYRLQKKISTILDCSYAGAEGVREAFNKAGDALAGIRLLDEKRLVEQLFAHLQDGLSAYGINDVRNSLNNQTSIILVNDNIDKSVLVECESCNTACEIIISTKKQNELRICESCKSESVFKSIDFIDFMAENNTRLEIISGMSEYGQMLKSLGSIGAILKYKRSQ